MESGRVWIRLRPCHVLDGKFWARYFTLFTESRLSQSPEPSRLHGVLCRVHDSYKARGPESGTCRASAMIVFFILRPSVSASGCLCFLFSGPASLGGWCWVWGRSGLGWGAASRARSAGSAGQGLGARQRRTGISSRARGAAGGGEDGGDQRSPGARWIPREEGGESAPAGRSSPGLRFRAPRPLRRLRKRVSGGRARGAPRGGGRVPRRPRPSRHAPGGRPAALPPLRQGATCLRAAGSCSRETTSPRPPGGRAPSAPSAASIGRRGPGLAVSRATGGSGLRAGGGPAPYCVAGGVERSRAEQIWQCSREQLHQVFREPSPNCPEEWEPKPVT